MQLVLTHFLTITKVNILDLNNKAHRRNDEEATSHYSYQVALLKCCSRRTYFEFAWVLLWVKHVDDLCPVVK